MPDAAAAIPDAPMKRPPVSVVPTWLANLASRAWRVTAMVGLVVAAWLLATLLWTVTASIAIAVVVSALFAPWVMRLRRQGRSRTAAAAVVWASALGAVVAIGLVVVLLLLPSVTRIVGLVADAVRSFEARLAAVNLPPAVSHVVDDLVRIVRDVAGPASAPTSGGFVGWAASAITILVLSTFLVFFFLRDGDRAWLWAFQSVELSKRDRITTAGEDALQRLAGYLRGTTMLSAIIAVTDLVFMWLLGVPSAVPLAILVFLGGYIPYFGGLVTTGIILLVTWATVGPVQVLVLLVMIAIRNTILGYGVRPALYGRTVSIHPALVLLVLPAGYQLAGIVGLFAAVPVTAVVFAVARATLAILEPEPPPALPGLVPAWVDRVAQWSWRILAALVLVAILVGVFVAIPLVLVPIVVATILAATVDPLVRWLVARGWSRTRASALAIGGGFLAIVGLIALVLVSLISGTAGLTNAMVEGANRANASSGGHLGVLSAAVQFGQSQIVGTVLAVANAVAAAAVMLVLSVLISFYLLRDGGALWHRAVTHARPEVAPDLRAAGARAFEVLGGYMSGTAAISFVGAFSQLVIMLVLGIDFALPVFVLSFFLCFIPYIGGFISTGIAFLLTVALGSPTDVVIMAVWTLVFNIVTGNIVSPIVYGRTVHLHPAVVLVAIPAGAAIAGVLGMFMIVPVLGIVSATWRTVLDAMGAPETDPDGRAKERGVDDADGGVAAVVEPVDPVPLARRSAPA